MEILNQILVKAIFLLLFSELEKWCYYVVNNSKNGKKKPVLMD